MADNPTPPESNQFEELVKNLQEQNELAQVAKDNSELSSNLQNQLLNDSNQLSIDQRESIENLIEALNGNKLADLEKQKEDKKIAEDTLAALEGILENTEDLGKIGGPVEAAGAALLAIPGALIGLAAGFVAGVSGSLLTLAKNIGKGLLRGVKAITRSLLSGVRAFASGIFKVVNKATGGLAGQFVNNARTFFTNLFTKVSTQFAKIVDSVRDTFKTVSVAVKNARSAFAAGFAGLAVFRKTTGQFGKLGFFGKLGSLFGTLAKPFQAIGTLITNLKNFILQPLRTLAKPFMDLKKLIPAGGGFSKTLKPITDAFKRILSVVKSVGSIFFKIGQFLGRLFVPVVVIFTTIKNIFKGFQEGQGFLDTISKILGGTLSDLFKFFVTDLLDLLRKAFAFIADKLGFENAAEFLSSFSFEEIFSNLFTTIKDSVLSFVDTIMETVKNIDFMGEIQNLGLNILKIMKKILSFPTAVAAGAVAAIAAAFPGGQTPGEAFMEGFNKVFTAGDDAIDAMKVQGDGSMENGSEIQTTSAENELARTTQTPIQAAAQNILSSQDNSTKTNTFIAQKPAAPDRTSMGLSTR